MCEGERRALLQVLFQLLLIKRTLAFIRRQHHDDIGPSRSFRRGFDREARFLSLLHRRGFGTQADHDFGDAAILEVVGMSMALAAIADDGHFLAFDQTQIGVAIVIDAH